MQGRDHAHVNQAEGRSAREANIRRHEAEGGYLPPMMLSVGAK